MNHFQEIWGKQVSWSWYLIRKPTYLLNIDGWKMQWKPFQMTRLKNRSKAILNQKLDMWSPVIFATSGCFVISAISHQPDNRHASKASLMYYTSLPQIQGTTVAVTLSLVLQSDRHSCCLAKLLGVAIVRCPKRWFNEWWCTMKVN